jgi:hypothetical protein
MLRSLSAATITSSFYPNLLSWPLASVSRSATGSGGVSMGLCSHLGGRANLAHNDLKVVDGMVDREASQNGIQGRKVCAYFCRMLHIRGATPAKSSRVTNYERSPEIGSSGWIASVDRPATRGDECLRPLRCQTHGKGSGEAIAQSCGMIRSMTWQERSATSMV